MRTVCVTNGNLIKFDKSNAKSIIGNLAKKSGKGKKLENKVCYKY